MEYNSKQQRYHKRLTRYLSWRWRIQQSYQHLTHSYSIGGPKGLLQVMEISMNRKPSLIRQVFEKTLDDAMRDQVIQGGNTLLKSMKKNVREKTGLKTIG